MKYILVAYRSEYHNYYMGCLMGSTESEHEIKEDLTLDELKAQLLFYALVNLTSGNDYAPYECTIICDNKILEDWDLIQEAEEKAKVQKAIDDKNRLDAQLKRDVEDIRKREAKKIADEKTMYANFKRNLEEKVSEEKGKEKKSELEQEVEQKEYVLNLIKHFLDTPNLDVDGVGWPKVKESEIDALYVIIKKMADVKWGRDCDCDSPIQFVVSNRCKGYMRHIVIPHETKTDKECIHACRNISIMLDQLSTDLRIITDLGAMR